MNVPFLRHFLLQSFSVSGYSPFLFECCRSVVEELEAFGYKLFFCEDSRIGRTQDLSDQENVVENLQIIMGGLFPLINEFLLHLVAV